MTVKSMEKLENSKVTLEIEVDAAAFDAAINKVYHKQKGRISVPGFRIGKAPRKIIENRYGSGVFHEDAVEELYPEALDAAAKEKELDVVAYPEVEIVSMGKEGLVFKATLTVRPEVTLGEYKGLVVEKAEITVTDADMEQELAPLVRQATRIVEVERAAANGDVAVIDFEGFLEGVPFDGGKGEGHNLELGSNSFVPGFEEQVVGLKAGDEKDIDITFPENYAPELAGKAVVFKVVVQAVKENQKPELDDEFAQDVSEFDTLAALKKDLSDKLIARREDESQKAFEEAVMEQVTGNMTASIPDEMIAYEADKLVNNFAQQIAQQGMKLEDYLGMMGMDIAFFREDAKRTALRRIQNDLALRAIIAAEKIEVSEAEIDEELSKLAEQYKMELDAIKAAVPLEELTNDLSYRKALALVKDSAVTGKPKKAAAKKTKKADEGEAAEKKPAAKKPAKKAEGEAEEKPAKKPAAKKTTQKAEGETEEKKPAAKKTAKKKEEAAD
jgi:trigger factor